MTKVANSINNINLEKKKTQPLKFKDFVKHLVFPTVRLKNNPTRIKNFIV